MGGGPARLLSKRHCNLIDTYFLIDLRTPSIYPTSCLSSDGQRVTRDKNSSSELCLVLIIHIYFRSGLKYNALHRPLLSKYTPYCLHAVTDTDIDKDIDIHRYRYRCRYSPNQRWLNRLLPQHFRRRTSGVLVILCRHILGALSLVWYEVGIPPNAGIGAGW